MGLMLRTGSRGQYYGNDYNSSQPLTMDQMKVNAQYIFGFLSAQGWTTHSICAMLGNMQAESSINPGRWQSDRVGGNATGHGYGLVQWTPYTKYTDWCRGNGYADPSEMDANLARILTEVVNAIQWIPVSQYNLSFKAFTQSKESISYLAKAFLLCYEKPADQSTSVQNARANNAIAWYEYITGGEYVDPGDPDVPVEPETKVRKRGYKFLLFDRKRRYYG